MDDSLCQQTWLSEGGQRHGGQQFHLQSKKTDQYHRRRHPHFQWFSDAYVCQTLCEALPTASLTAISQHTYEGSDYFPTEQVLRARLCHPSRPVSLAAFCSNFSMCLI